MTCHWIEQPLNHFAPNAPTYQQRYCIYDGFDSASSSSHVPKPIFLYTGNESPLEQYINQTGLMWELGKEMGATLVFAEHRYEGKSLPPNDLHKNCMSYSSSKQALADYAVLMDTLFRSCTTDQHPIIIAFGGSYGGMLAGWMRMKYPNIIGGAIAASAPIWGFPRRAPQKIDAAYRVVSRGLEYGPNPVRDGTVVRNNHCAANLRSAWPLMMVLSQSQEGRSKLGSVFRLCSSPILENDISQLLDWAQSPWFDMAEGSFPYPSSYIPFSLHMGLHPLPAWPLQTACWSSGLHQDMGIVLEGDVEQVKYTISYGKELILSVDWDNVTVVGHKETEFLWNNSTGVANALLTSVRKAVAVWFNVSKQEPCFNITPAINEEQGRDSRDPQDYIVAMKPQEKHQRRLAHPQDYLSCQDKIQQEGSWGPLCCNEDMNIVVTMAHGLGQDIFWPPSHARGTRSYSQIIDPHMYDFCLDTDTGQYGYPKIHDYDSKWLDIYYGSSQLQGHSNIIFSNGLLDPWSAAGVLLSNTKSGVYNMTANNEDDMVAVVMEFGGHHTDLMYSNPTLDPPCVKHARSVERKYIQKWIQEWNDKQQRWKPTHTPAC